MNTPESNRSVDLYERLNVTVTPEHIRVRLFYEYDDSDEDDYPTTPSPSPTGMISQSNDYMNIEAYLNSEVFDLNDYDLEYDSEATLVNE